MQASSRMSMCVCVCILYRSSTFFFPRNSPRVAVIVGVGPDKYASSSHFVVEFLICFVKVARRLAASGVKVALLAALESENSIVDSSSVSALHPGNHMIILAAESERLAVICQIIRPVARTEFSPLVDLTARKLVLAILIAALAAAYSPQQHELTTAGESERIAGFVVIPV